MTTAQRRYGGRAVAERKAERRDRFLRAATRIFAERGYPNCSLSDVCAAAGLSRRQFYEEFATREDVLVAAYDRIQDEAAAAVTAALTEAGALPVGRAALTTVLTAYLNSIDSDPYRAKVAFVEVVGVSERMERHRRERRHRWAEVIDLAVVPMSGPEARIAGVPGLAAGALVGAVNGLVDEWLFRQPRPPIGDLVELLVRVADSLIERQ
ncbi:TetR/AcrR family transcriptional regulator [Nocardia sp. NPDC052254]|uniref:TetR/AcrR family transcriptional regulator n=1 Tax=Nocardia sp. NPDC052254 TaxID=3155681 RepID=UPI00341FFF3E